MKPGTTADVYSIDPTQQDKFQGLGGGGNANSAWSSMASIPGVFVPPNQNGYVGAAATISIRGGDYDQIGYEIDGVPVNRAFDNYPSGPLSSLRPAAGPGVHRCSAGERPSTGSLRLHQPGHQDRDVSGLSSV